MHSVLRRANHLPEYSDKMSASGKRQRIANLRQKRDKVAAAVLTMRLQREMARLKEDVQTSQEVFGEQAAAAAAQMQELRAEIVRIKEKKEAAIARSEREANELEYWDRNEECVIRRAGGKFRFDQFGFCADRTIGRNRKFGNYKMAIKYVQHVRLEHDGLTAELMLDGRRVLVRRASVPEKEELRRTRAHYQEQLDIKRADKRNLARAQNTEYMRRWRQNRNRAEVGGMQPENEGEDMGNENEVNFEQLFDNADDENDMAVDLPDGVGDHQVDLLEVAVHGNGDNHEEAVDEEEVETPVLDLSNRPDLVTRAEMDPAVEYICARHNLPVNAEGLCVQGVERESSAREENKVSCLDKVSGPSSKVEGEVTLDEVVNRSGMNEADGLASHEATIEAMEQQGKEQEGEVENKASVDEEMHPREKV